MGDIESWREEQTAVIEALKDDVKKWQAEIKKGARTWHDDIVREISNWKQEIKGEIETIKGETKHGYKRTTRESAGSEDILGPSTGESDQAEADDASGRKRRGGTSGAN